MGRWKIAANQQLGLSASESALRELSRTLVPKSKDKRRNDPIVSRIDRCLCFSPSLDWSNFLTLWFALLPISETRLRLSSFRENCAAPINHCAQLIQRG